MFVLGQKVTRKDQKSPVGVIEQINWAGDNQLNVLIHWGTSDKQRFTELLHISEVQDAAD